FFFSSRRRHTSFSRDWSSDVCSSDLLAPLNSFILPGGTPAAAYLHLARTIVRRAERLMTEAAEREPINPEAIKYCNRLSDLLFEIGRASCRERESCCVVDGCLVM